MLNRPLLLAAILIPSLMSCSNNNETQAKPRQVGIGSDRPIIQKKQVDSMPLANILQVS